MWMSLVKSNPRRITADAVSLQHLKPARGCPLAPRSSCPHAKTFLGNSSHHDLSSKLGPNVLLDNSSGMGQNQTRELANNLNGKASACPSVLAQFDLPVSM